MTIAAHRYEIFINAPRQRVWDALAGEADTVRYFHGTRFESTFEPGARFVNRIVAADREAAEGVIEVCDPPNRLVYTWHVLYDAAMAAEPPGRVEWTLVDANPEGTVTRVTLRHGDLALSPVTWRNVELGWVGILDSLKSLLETGQPLPPIDDQPGGAGGVADDVPGEWHRAQGVIANNSIWELLDGRDLSPDDADELLTRAYAAAYHWRRATGGGPINIARAAYMIAKAHTVLGHADMALRSIERYAALLDAADDATADFDLAYLDEGRARALAAAGRLGEAASALALARSRPISDPEDRAIVESDLASGPWFGLEAVGSDGLEQRIPEG
jgi:uncharacterized protein YndB with AHSA1/START domain